MLSTIRALFTVAITVCGLGAGHIASAEASGTGSPIPFLFVQSAPAGSLVGDTLMLHNMGSTLFFSDRPYRISGHVKTGTFVEAWHRGAESFQADPPNATLSVFDEDGPNNVVVELFDPRYDGTTLQYRIRVIEGKTPSTFKDVSLFIDHHHSNLAWGAGGAAGGVLGGMMLGKSLEKSKEERKDRPQTVYVEQPDYTYRQAPPAPCECRCD